MTRLGADIKNRRLAFQLPVETVANLAGLDSQRLLGIEASAFVPSAWELAAVAEALACDPAELLAGGAEDPRRSVARFRGGQAAMGLTGGDLRLLARGAEAGRVLAHLKSRLDEPVSQIPSNRQVRGPSGRREPWADGYDLGAAARALLSPDGSIRSIQELFEAAGIHVAGVQFEGNVEAASLYEVGASPVILLNTRAPRFAHPLARRAILAHELCHLLHDGGERELTVVTREQDGSAIEQRANGFAPSFIAPKELVVSAMKVKKVSLKDPKALVLDLANAWGLSFEGAAWHAKNLNLLDPRVAEKLAAGPKTQIRVDFEPDLQRTPPDQFGIEVKATELSDGLLSETAIVACAEGLISRERASEILSLR
jgi:Zn-dependent peptidase ImmA (M78 family)